MSDRYHLYLDESETHTNGKNKIFCIAGIIVKEDVHNNVLAKEINSMKEQIWGSVAINNNKYILHEKDIRFAQNRNNKFKLNEIDPIYHIFKHNRTSNVLYNGLENIVGKHEVTVIGGCIVEKEIYKHYDDYILPDKQLIIMQVILENFCHFLRSRKAEGVIFYEAVEEKANNIMRRRFNHIELMGTMYISPEAIQKHIIDLRFPNKSENVAGLQIADFIPNNIVRKVGNKKKHRFNLYEPIRVSRYDGSIMKREKFGVKVIPKLEK
ncbi:DUF3800 domain-containing protein [Paraliobacillus sp. X-1268]|uniref:DUF3800 domain-containing protein n=1 Tax=Paraliobacillus sp. X-1268 TaxID=2213193 RepID=UPI000E3E61AC|nr:DUF3800 domain-containing protein [Paraliobacillus sp. X-1268]